MYEISMDGERARKVITRSIRRVMGRFWSEKSDRTIRWESQLERDLVYLLEFSPSVLRYREQPETVLLSVGGVPRRYTPDFMVEMAAERVIIEVKPEKHAASPENAALFACAAEAFAKAGYRYQVLTEREIRVQPRLSTIALLLRYRRCPVSAAERAMVVQALPDAPTFGALLAATASSGITRGTVLTLLSHHILIEETIKERYLKRELPSIRSVCFAVTDRIRRHNEAKPQEVPLKPVNFKTVYRAVRRLNPYEVMAARRGKRAADREFAMVGPGPQTTRPLERVECDHTKLDLYVVDDRHGELVPIGRPWLTLMVDHYSRLPVGYYLGFKPPGFESVALALR